MVDRAVISRWQGNQRYTRRVIEAMPEETFDFKPCDGMKSFKSQASHIATWLRTNLRHINGDDVGKPPMSTKQEILAALDDFFDLVLAYLKQATAEELGDVVKMWYGKTTKAGLLSTMDNHLSHHRGQMIVYLRLQEIKPPSYVGW